MRCAKKCFFQAPPPLLGLQESWDRESLDAAAGRMRTWCGAINALKSTCFRLRPPLVHGTPGTGSPLLLLPVG
ncbi:hypothetical protein NDU88_004425 [Pleurodeles waltl]|uniref:Uncharacterized protein n=1 Tax=Pleurodeles waltl TaxID=8319 RepID=A0AAV7LJS1_PLEWA|nr:hypothetical protein NDU88_004425 [Pleurodeles waltl]